MNSEVVTIEARNLLVKYGEVSALSIPKLSCSGKIIALIGHNGSGKSTFIKSVLQLLPSYSGELSLHAGGRQLIPERDMGYSPENGAVFADVTVVEYIKLWCRIKWGDAEYYRSHGRVMLEKMHIPPLYEKLGRELSKGQRRRVQIAVGFLICPRILCLDEPLEGLDIEQAGLLTSVIRECSKDTSLLISSHRIDVIERLADQVIMLDRGKILAAGNVHTVSAILGVQSLVIALDDLLEIRSNEFIELLQQRFSSSLIHRMGSQVIVTGGNADLKALKILFAALKIPVPRIEITHPSLTDAVHAHLRTSA